MKFPINDIVTLLDERLEFNLAESTNKDLILNEIWDDEFSKELKNLKLEYGTSKGNKKLREKIGEKLNVDKNQIVITNGAVFGIFLSMLCLCENGDEVITVQPNFPPSMDLIEGLGFKRVLIKLSFEEEYQIDINKLFSLITNKTRLIILVSPLNPTGTIHSKEEILEISERLNNQYPNCKLIIDETYREATYGDNDVIKTYAGLRENIITISSLSKSYGTPGLRIGWLQSSDQKFVEQVGVAKTNTVISNSVLDEFVALKVLNKEFEILENRRIHSITGLELTKNWVEQNNELVNWTEPKAGALCCIKLNEKRFAKDNIEEFYSLSKAIGIQIANGEWFGEPKRYFRLGFGYLDTEKLDFTLNKLSEILIKATTNKVNSFEL
ncbi:pyridoxal phosphate-dependent aminotransferase [Maribacter halichondriae]|uniref:pyridoxal phosphate-dependent aminotransferase n=1 Tax=Maribacter halichondriae TaxID=2980554 RepID=UPI0023594C70|nr:pyridoxal phosphate-dependent aminotransferase [Maribacter sp. Hal144]